MYCFMMSNVYLGLTVFLCFGLMASDKDADSVGNDVLADDAKSPKPPTVQDEVLSSNTKSEDNDKEWNPKGVLLSDNPADWPGHLKPFGSTGRSRNVDIYKKFPKPALFFSEYVAPYIPLLMRNASRTNEAFAQWRNDSFFLNRPQSRLHWFPSSPTSDISFKEFIERYKKEKIVFEDEVPFFLSDHIPLPSPLLCESVTKELSNTMLYIGGGDHQNSITARDVDTLRCVYDGRQDIVLVNQMNFGNKMPGILHVINVTHVDYVEFPNLREVEYLKASLNRGDCIYIPPKWCWQVNSINSSKSVDIMWHHKVKNVQSAECMVTAVEPNIGKATFAEQTSWTAAWKGVALHYFASYLLNSASYDIKNFSAAIMRESRLFKNITVWTDEYDEITQELHAILDINKDKIYSLADLEALTPEITMEIFGHLEDRMSDFQDVMNDQQFELREDQAKAKAAKEGLSLSKLGDDPKLAVENYINNYLKVLEDVLTESMEEVSSTGKVPDLKDRLAARQAEIDGEKPFVARSKGQPIDDHKTAKEEAKAKIKAKQDKRRSEEKEEDEKITEDASYDVVDDSVVEEILADEDEDEIVVKPPHSKKKVTTKPSTKQQATPKPESKKKPTEKVKPSTTPGSKPEQTEKREGDAKKKAKKEKKKKKDEL